MTFILLLKIYSWVFTSYSYIGHECCGLEIRYIMHLRGHKSEACVNFKQRLFHHPEEKRERHAYPTCCLYVHFLFGGPGPRLLSWSHDISSFASSCYLWVISLQSSNIPSTFNSCVFNFEQKPLAVTRCRWTSKCLPFPSALRR